MLEKSKKLIRLKDYNYSSQGVYFITVCTFHRQDIFGEIIDGEMHLNKIGVIVKSVWEGLPKFFKYTEIDEYIIMPDHFHGVVIFNKDISTKKIKNGTAQSLGSFVRLFKRNSTINIKKISDFNYIWQRNYWDRIIRNSEELNNVRQYIINNPRKYHDKKDSNHIYYLPR